MITKGQERCLYVFPERGVRPDHRGAAHRAGHRQGGAGLQPGVLRQRLRRGAGQAGPGHDPAARCATTPRLQRDCVVIGANTRLEIWDAAAWEAYLARPGGRVLCGVGGGAARRSVTGAGYAAPPCSARSPPAAGWPSADVTSPAPGGTTGLPARRADGDLAGHAVTAVECAGSRRARSPRREHGEKGVRWARRQPVTCRSWSTGCSRLLAPALEPPGAVLVDATLGRAGHARALLAAHPGLDLIGLDTDAARDRGIRRLLAAYADRVTLAHAVYDQIADVLARAGLRTRAGRPVRPRGVLAAAGRAWPRVRLLLRRPAGHADGPGPAAHRGGGAQHLPGGPAGPGAAGVRRGEVRAPDRGGGGAGAVRGPADLDRAADRDHPRLDPGPGPPHRRQPGQADLPGAADRGERRNWTRWPGRCPRRWTRSRWAAGSSCWPTTRWRTGRSSGPWPPARRTPRRPACRCRWPTASPQFRLLTRGAERPSSAELAANPRAASARLRAAEAYQGRRVTAARPTAARASPG